MTARTRGARSNTDSTKSTTASTSQHERRPWHKGACLCMNISSFGTYIKKKASLRSYTGLELISFVAFCTNEYASVERSGVDLSGVDLKTVFTKINPLAQVKKPIVNRSCNRYCAKPHKRTCGDIKRKIPASKSTETCFATCWILPRARQMAPLPPPCRLSRRPCRRCHHRHRQPRACALGMMGRQQHASRAPPSLKWQ